MATVMKMIAGISKGKKRNENERKHIGNSRKPATVNSQGRPRKPSRREEGGAAMRHAMASAGHAPAPARSGSSEPARTIRPPSTAIVRVMTTPRARRARPTSLAEVAVRVSAIRLSYVRMTTVAQRRSKDRRGDGHPGPAPRGDPGLSPLARPRPHVVPVDRRRRRRQSRGDHLLLRVEGAARVGGARRGAPLVDPARARAPGGIRRPGARGCSRRSTP